MNEMIWIGVGVMTVALIAWMLFMMTCRTDDWLRLVKDEDERKARRHERTKENGTIITGIVRAAMKK